MPTPAGAYQRGNITDMKEQEATRLAEDAARAEGRNLDDYTAPQVRHDTGSWRFFYKLKPPTPPGGHFSIKIDDHTGDTRFIPGR